MKKRSFKLKARLHFLLVALLAIFLFGCGTNSRSQSAQLVSAPAIADGNVENGRALFMGYAHFQNDGPPCMGCHSVGNNGLLGGGAMGPDLTDVTERKSQTEILAVLSNIGRKTSPVMQPIYTEHPLTWEEQVDLLAFLKASVGQPQTNKEPIVFGISLGGFAAAAAVLGFLYRGRLRSVRRSLVNKAQKELL